jgi:hypothetical protein
MAGILSGHIVLASATERVALANSTQVANFTDSDLTDLLTGFTATIDWGDGTTSPGTITGSNGSFSVLGGHSYSDEGNFTLSATIVRSADNATFTDTGNIAVAEHDVLAAQGTTIIGNPGTLLNNVSVATFTDTDTAAVAGDFQAIVDWGDATTSPGTITGSNGSFAVSGSHTYAFAGQDTITVTVVDSAPGTANTVGIGEATIGLNVQVSLTTATERVALPSNTVVASFTDGNPADLASGFTATIDWGDGTTSTGTIAGSNGSFSILGGGHSYADEGDFTLSATLIRTSDATVVTGIGDVTVIEHDVLAAQGKTISGDPGQLLNNVTVATFTDTDTAALASDFVATIDWGDGTTSTGTIAGSNGSFTVIGSGHAYASAGQDTFTVTVTDPAPGTAITSATGTANIGLVGQEVLNSATERVALAPDTVVTSFADGNLGDLPGGFVTTIDWGDGTTSAATVAGSNGAFSVEGGHTYADEGNFTLTSTVTRISDNTTVTETENVAVAEHDVLAGQGTTLTAAAGQPLTNATVATFTDTDTAALASEFVATINWGDGTTTAGTIAGSNGSFAINGTHTYATTGQDTITVTMAEPAPGTATATADSFRFDHVNQPPVNTVPGPLGTSAHTELPITGLSVADPDATTLTTTLHVDHGTLTLAAVGGTAVSGSGTGTVTLAGSVAQIDATLGAANNLVYVSQAGFYGTDTLTMFSNDGGSSGSGGPKTDTDTVAITVLAGGPISSATPPHLSDFHLL